MTQAFNNKRLYDHICNEAIVAQIQSINTQYGILDKTVPGTQVTWGTIIGNIEDQTDLVNFVNELVEKVIEGDIDIDLSKYALKTDLQTLQAQVDAIKVPTKVSELENDANYLTQHQDISNLATKSELEAKADKTQLTDYALKTEIPVMPDMTAYPTKDEMDIAVNAKANQTDVGALQTKVDEVKAVADNAVQYSLYDNRKFIQLANYDSLSGVMTNGDAGNLIMMSKWDKVDIGTPKVPCNLNAIDGVVTINDDKTITTKEDADKQYAKAESLLPGVVTDVFGQMIYNPYNVQVAYNKAIKHGTTGDEIEYVEEPAERHNFVIDGATTENAGVMAAADKAKLDAINVDTLATKEDVSNLCVFNMGNFDTLDAASERACNGGVYDNLNYRILLFTVNNQSSGIIINNVDHYKTEQYMYYNMYRYTRRFTRVGDNAYVTPWRLDDYVALAGKGVRTRLLFALTEESTSDDIKEALTFPNGEGVLTKEDLDTCIEKGMTLRDGDNGGTVIVGMNNYGIHYYFTYIGCDNYVTNPNGAPQIRTIQIDISDDGQYSVFKTANKGDILTTEYEKLPVAANIGIAYNLNDRVYSESTILGWFGCDTIDELKQKIANSDMLYMTYINTQLKAYRMPIHFIELKNNDKQLVVITSALDMTDDNACRYEITANLDGTIIEENRNVKVVKTHMVMEDQMDVYATKDELPVMVNIPIRTNATFNNVQTKETILGWFGCTTDAELKTMISQRRPMFLKYGISLSYNPHYYKMPIQYIAYESANQVKIVTVGLDTSNDVVSKYEILMNLDGTVIENGGNIKMTITPLILQTEYNELEAKFTALEARVVALEQPST